MRRSALHVLPLVIGFACTMSRIHKRRAERSSSGDTESPPAGASSVSEGEASAVAVKLLAAGFYGLSSFLIVVVNKSVLTSYR